MTKGRMSDSWHETIQTIFQIIKTILKSNMISNSSSINDNWNIAAFEFKNMLFGTYISKTGGLF